MNSSPSLSAVCVAGFTGAALAIATHRFLVTKKLLRAVGSSSIQRGTVSERSADYLIHNGVVHLSGQVGVISTLDSSDIKAQTQQTLAKIDKLLERAGTDRSHILSAQIWLLDIKRDFAPMNEVWNEWVGQDPANKGVRACVEAAMARPSILVEVKVTAALP